MKSPLPLPVSFGAVAALFALAACNSGPQVVDANPDPMATELANAKPVELPPAIKADVTFRCKDQSLVYVTFFEGDKLATIRTTQTGSPTRLTAPAAGQPLVADGGWSLAGTPKEITLSQPGKASLTCHV